MKNRVWMIAAAVILTVSSLAGCGSFQKDETLLKVNDSEITAGVANFYARYTQAQYETYYGAYLGDNMWSSEAEEGKTYEESVKESILENMERMLVLEEHMKDYDVALSDAEKDAIKEIAQEFDEDNTLENKEKITADTKTVERVLTLIAIQQKMSGAIEAEADTNVTDEEAAQKSMDYVFFAYAQESAEDTADAADAEDGDESSDSEVTDERKAEVKKQAEDFAANAKADSSKGLSEIAEESGVEVSTATFDADSQTPDADLVEAADALEVNGVTDVVETDSGCYVAKVTSLMDREATDARKSEIVQERQTEHYTEVTDKWIKDAKVDIRKSLWKKIDFNDLSVTMKQTEQDPYTDAIQTDDQADAEDGTGEVSGDTGAADAEGSGE